MDRREVALRGFLRTRFSGYEERIGSCDPLDQVVDSLGLFELVEFIERQFSVSIPNEDFSPRRFATIEGILHLVEEQHPTPDVMTPSLQPERAAVASYL